MENNTILNLNSEIEKYKIQIKQLEIQHNKMELLLDSSLKSFEDIMMLAVDKNYCYLYFNECHKNIMRLFYNQDIELGNNILDYVDVLKDRKQIKKNCDLALSGEHHLKIEEFKGMKQASFESSFSPIFNSENEVIGVSISSRDISEKIIQDNNLRYEKELAQKYLNLAGTVIIVINTEGNIVLLNQKGCSVLGVDESNIFGQNWFDNFVPKELLEAQREIYVKLLTGEVVFTKRYENNIVNHKGETKTISWDSNILHDIDGNITGIISSGEDVTEIRKKERELLHMSYHDVLTKIYNRRYLFENIDKLWLQSIRERSIISFIMIDIDNFKLYNDTFGHIEGDHVLIKVAENLKLSMRRSFDIVGRYGGEEFLVVLPNTPLEGAYNVAETIRKKIENLKVVHSEKSELQYLTISLGVTSIIPDRDTSIEETINQADLALFQAKENGKNRTEKFKRICE